MDIRTLIELKYEVLKSYCNLYIISNIEITKSGIKDIEDIDLLHSLIIRWLKKYKTFTFESEEIGFQTLKKEFMGERKYQKLKKPESKYLIEYNESVDN